MTSNGSAYLDRYATAILKLLSLEPLRSYYQREIARKVGVSLGKTNQVLRALEKEEIVLKERRGNVDLYKYNLRSPVARYLKVLFTLNELNELTRNLREVSNKIVIFGSCADGTDSLESDIDILILTSNKSEARCIIEPARRTLKRRLSPLILNPIEFSGLREKDHAFYEQMSRGIVLWQQEE